MGAAAAGFSGTSTIALAKSVAATVVVGSNPPNNCSVADQPFCWEIPDDSASALLPRTAPRPRRQQTLRRWVLSSAAAYP